MGSVRRDARGAWQARYRNPAGQQRTKSFATKRDADAFLRGVEAAIDDGTWVDPILGKIAFRDYATRWRAGVAHLRPSTEANLDVRLNFHILPAFGDWPIGSIRPADVRAFVARLVGKGLAPSTVKPIYQALARILATAALDGVIARTPCVGILLPKEASTQEMHFLTAKEVARLAGTIDDRYRVLIYTAAYTGMRWGELAGLPVANVDLLAGRIQVVQALTETNGHIAVGPTKTGKRRAISLPRFLAQMLGEHIGRYPTTTGLVFSSERSQSLRRNFYRRIYKPAVLAAGLPRGLRFHDLRHTCAALLIAQGAHPKEIQERLGHTTIRLTFDRYGHLFPTLDSRLRDGLDALWEANQDEGRPDAEVIDIDSRHPEQPGKDDAPPGSQATGS